MTSWVRSGIPCICVEQEWHDFFSDDEVVGPEIGDRCVVSVHSVIDGSLFIKVMGDDFSYEASAFRPLTNAERDVDTFRSVLTGSYAPARPLEHAWSS